MPKSQFDGVSDAALKAELGRREKTQAMAAMPKPLAQPNFTGLTKMLVEGVKHLNDEGYESKDFKHYVFEAAMEAVFGRTIWTWWNSKLR